MNKINAMNLFQGILNLIVAYIYFTTGDRISIILLLFVLFLTSLTLISLGISRRRRIIEILETTIYILFFGFSFMGVEDFKSLIRFSEPVPNFFWVPWTLGLIFNYGEWGATLISKLVKKPEE